MAEEISEEGTGLLQNWKYYASGKKQLLRAAASVSNEYEVMDNLKEKVKLYLQWKCECSFLASADDAILMVAW